MASAAVNSRPEILSIQYLRALAAFGVAVFHLGQIFGYELKFGAAGVDIFFVISGFIMWMVTRNRETGPAGFAARRLIRIVPLYWLVTLTLAAGAALKPNLFPLDHPTAPHVILSLLFIPHPLPDSPKWMPLVTQGWTLNYEMYFYFLVALSLMGWRKLQFYFLNAVLLACVAYGYLAHAGAGEIYSESRHVYTSPLLLEFLTGIYICRAWLKGRLLGRNPAYLAIALGIVALAADVAFHFSYARILRQGAPATLIVLGMVSLEYAKALPRWNWLKFLGDASYSIYLVHYLAWLAVSIVVARLGVALNSAVYLATLASALLAGSLTYAFVEKPVIRFLHRVLLRPAAGKS